MKKFSELLNTVVDEKSSFLLGAIYRWILIDKNSNIILAYSSYKKGKRSNEILSKDIDFYYKEHLNKLKKFLGDEFSIDLNQDIKQRYNFEKNVSSGVSVIFDFTAINFPDGVECKETYVCGLIEKTK